LVVKVQGNIITGACNGLLCNTGEFSFAILGNSFCNTVLSDYAINSHEHIQVETLYLLIMLKELGKEYKIDQNVLSKYFNIDCKKKKCKSNLNYLSIVVLLFYIENKVRYNDLKDILKEYIIEKFKRVRRENKGKITELTLLLFDSIVCPYLEINYRKSLLDLYGVDDENIKVDIIEKRKYWFTKWSEFNFSKELEAKRSEEVY